MSISAFTDFIEVSGPIDSALNDDKNSENFSQRIAAIVINAQTGIEMTTRRMMAWAEERELWRLIIVTGIDGDTVDPPALLTQIQETFGTQCLPINLPPQRGR